jgi:release factor glutamine methyltransferase
MISIGELLKEGYEILKSVDIDSYAIDCELLLGKVINKDRLFLLLNREKKVSKEIEKQYFELIELRKDKMPMKYILGECEFMGLSFIVKQGVLIPRPDTEVLVEKAIEEIKKNSFKTICDLCCGSGAIGIAIGHFIHDIEVSCSDISDIACNITNENIKRLSVEDRVRVAKGDLLKQFIVQNQKFDMIVSNPPYIKKNIIPTLMEDVKNYEPYEALCGGEDGLDFYKKITEQSVKTLNLGGILLFEIGHDQRSDVENIMFKGGFNEIISIKDLSGRDRVVQGKL